MKMTMVNSGLKGSSSYQRCTQHSALIENSVLTSATDLSVDDNWVLPIILKHNSSLRKMIEYCNLSYASI